jgi:hypothetical protein
MIDLLQWLRLCESGKRALNHAHLFNLYTNCHRYNLAIKTMLPVSLTHSWIISTEALIEFVKPEDGTPIAGFPATPGEYWDYNNSDIDFCTRTARFTDYGTEGAKRATIEGINWNKSQTSITN